MEAQLLRIAITNAAIAILIEFFMVYMMLFVELLSGETVSGWKPSGIRCRTAERPMSPGWYGGRVGSVGFAMRQRPAAVAAAMMERSRLEERGHGAFAFRALHALHIAVDGVSRVAFGVATGWHGSADPDGFALVAHDGMAVGTGGRLTGHQGNRRECENRDLEGLKNVMFVFHDGAYFVLVVFDAGIVVIQIAVPAALK